jgi:ribosome-binding factor A
MSRRTEQISGIIRRIAALRVLEVPPNVASVVNVTRVDVSPDLQYADIFITALKGAEEAAGFLNRKRSAIRHDLGKELRSLHTIPAVRIHVDKRSEELSRLDELLDKLK